MPRQSMDDETKRERARASWRRWYRRNARYNLERVRKYRAANKEKIVAMGRAWRVKNKERLAEGRRRDRATINLRRKLRECGIDPRVALS